MGFGFKQPLVGEKRCVTTLITAAEETSLWLACLRLALNDNHQGFGQGADNPDNIHYCTLQHLVWY